MVAGNPTPVTTAASRTQKGMTTTAKPRVQPGVPAGGEFTAYPHSDPAIRLAGFKAAEEAFAFHPGTRVFTGHEFGTVSEAGRDKNRTVTVNLDSGGTLFLKNDKLVPWDAHLDDVMPAVAYDPAPETTEVTQDEADRFLRMSLVRMRNALDSTAQTGQTYFQGVALGEAEVAAALMDADADPEAIGLARGNQLLLGLPIGGEHEELTPTAIKKRVAAPLSSLRARRLAGHFARQAITMQEHLGSIPQNDWETAEWTKQGAMYAYSKAAVRFANGARTGDNTYYEERFTLLLIEGETNVNTVIGETFDEGAW